MTRCFIAIDFPDEVKDRLLAVQPVSLPKMRLIDRTQMHLTLHFLGELDERGFEQTRAAIAKVQVTEFTLDLRGLGQFPPQGQPRVLWAGIESNPALQALHRVIGELLVAETGYIPESRPFSPHITLARFNGPTSSVLFQKHLQTNENFHVPSIPVRQFALYSSTFADGIPTYKKEEVVHLRREIS